MILCVTSICNAFHRGFKSSWNINEGFKNFIEGFIVVSKIRGISTKVKEGDVVADLRQEKHSKCLFTLDYDQRVFSSGFVLSTTPFRCTLFCNLYLFWCPDTHSEAVVSKGP